MKSEDLQVGRSPRIFQIGFNKCGTTSFHRFMCDSGISSLHWLRGSLAVRMMARIDAGQDPVEDYPKVIAFSDIFALEPDRLIEPYKRFDYLHNWYPDGLFILNTRNRENWISSRLAHQSPLGGFLKRYAQCLSIGESEVIDFWRAEWEVHHTLVRAHFKGSSNFLEFDIEADQPEKLRAFLAPWYERCATTKFGFHNRSRRLSAS